MLKTCNHLGRLKPHSLASLQAVIQPFLLWWGCRQKEMRIKAFRHHPRRNPVSKVSKVVDCQHQAFSLDYCIKRALTVIQRSAICSKAWYSLFIDCQYLSTAIRQQHISFLKEFTNRCGPQSTSRHSTS